MSKIVSTKKINAIFLTIVLITGTIFTFSPSFMIPDAQAFQMDNNYESDYGMDSYDDKQSYGKDSNSYDKSKDSSSNVIVKKIKCNNINANLNGFNGIEVGTLPTALNGLATNEEQASADEGEIGASFSGSSGDGRPSGSDSDSRYVCINNNDFTVIREGPIPIPPLPPVNNVCTVWTENAGSNAEIFFAVSHDNGLTFSEPENISETSRTSYEPQVICEGNNVYVVWTDVTPGNQDIFFARSTNGGLTFSEPENISENAEQSEFPQISSEGNNVYVVWHEFTAAGDVDIFFARSTDRGMTFSEPENISENAGASLLPQISSEGNNVYVVWIESTSSDVFFARSTDRGMTFSEPENISENTGFSLQLQISSEGNNVYVVWIDTNPGNRQVFFARSTDGGLTFSEPDNISESAGDSTSLQISSEGNNVYVGWNENPSSDVFSVRSTNNGLTFSEPENISETTGSAQGAQISSEGNNVYVVWTEFTPPDFTSDIFFSVSTDGGLTFSEPENISEIAGFSTLPQISSEGNNVYVVWQELTPDFSNAEIFFSVSTDGGLTFRKPDNISESAGSSQQPLISSSTS